MSKEELQIIETLEMLQPAMETDGGGVEFVSVIDGVVSLKFKGACLLCPSINMTLKIGIEKTLKEKYPYIKAAIKYEY